jgi:hypothetical protein
MRESCGSGAEALKAEQGFVKKCILVILPVKLVSKSL